MLQRMETDVMFLDPDDVNEGSATLIENDCDVEVLVDWIDPYGPAVWVRARITTELDMDQFFDWVENLVKPLGGDVQEAGPA